MLQPSATTGDLENSFVTPGCVLILGCPQNKIEKFNADLIGKRIKELQGRDCCNVSVLCGTGLTRQ